MESDDWSVGVVKFLEMLLSNGTALYLLSIDFENLENTSSTFSVN